MDKLIAMLLVALLGFLAIAFFAALFSFITQWAWSGTLVPLFHFPELSLFQAWQLNILGGMLCKGSAVSSK
jgi:hypothetical protein